MAYIPHPFLGTQPAELANYVLEELSRLSADLNASQGAASLFRVVSTALAVDPTPQKLVFEAFTPQRDFRAVAPELGSNLYIRKAGVVGVSFTIDGGPLDQAGIYEVRLFVNDVPVDLFAVFDPSNQTAFGTLAAVGTFRVPGSSPQTVATRLDLRISALAPRAFTFTKGYFSAWWLGD